MLDQVVAAAEAIEASSPVEAVEALGSVFHPFHRAYLDHMLHEEQEIEPVLLANFTDEEMIADQGAIMAEMPFTTLLLWFRFIVPARSVADNRQVLGGFTAAAPAEAVAAVWDVLRGVLPPDRFLAITTDL